MIPFDVDPSLYMSGIFFIILFLISCILFLCNFDGSEFLKNLVGLCIFGCLLMSTASFGLALAGTTSQEEIFICNHYIDKYDDSMVIMDYNGNLYNVYDRSIKMRVRDGINTNVVIIKPFLSKPYISKSDIHPMCGNQTCGAPPS